jgi:hypothetical protein
MVTSNWAIALILGESMSSQGMADPTGLLVKFKKEEGKIIKPS